jgi:hypothetical protein
MVVVVVVVVVTDVVVVDVNRTCGYVRRAFDTVVAVVAARK